MSLAGAGPCRKLSSFKVKSRTSCTSSFCLLLQAMAAPTRTRPLLRPLINSKQCSARYQEPLCLYSILNTRHQQLLERPPTCRNFSTTRASLARLAMKQPKIKQPSRKSIAIEKMEQMEHAEYQDDIGVLPGTIDVFWKNDSGRYQGKHGLSEDRRYICHTHRGSEAGAVETPRAVEVGESAGMVRDQGHIPVSYTHLTLPTIYSV